MKSYKDCSEIYLGESDVAALVLFGYRAGEGTISELLRFCKDGAYYTYLVTDPGTEIGSHYKKIGTFQSWVKIYDDNELRLTINAEEINFYRAGMMGCIIQAMGNAEIFLENARN